MQDDSKCGALVCALCFLSFLCRGLVLLNVAGAMNRKGLMQDDLTGVISRMCFFVCRGLVLLECSRGNEPL